MNVNCIFIAFHEFASHRGLSWIILGILTRSNTIAFSMPMTRLLVSWLYAVWEEWQMELRGKWKEMEKLENFTPISWTFFGQTQYLYFKCIYFLQFWRIIIQRIQNEDCKIGIKIGKTNLVQFLLEIFLIKTVLRFFKLENWIIYNN